MAGWQAWLAIVGGIVAIVGQFWGGPGSTSNFYLPVIGGALAAIGGIGSMMNKGGGAVVAPTP